MKKRILFTICMFVLIIHFLTVLFVGEKALKELAPSPMEKEVGPGERVSLTGEVYRIERKSNIQILYLRKNAVFCQQKILRESRLMIYDKKYEKLQLGNRIRVEGEAAFFDSSRNPGNFDQNFYYQMQNIHACVWSSKISREEERVFPIRNFLSEIRGKCGDAIRGAIGEEQGGILSAMVLGEKSLVDPEMKELYQKNGISHVLAISGLHLSLIGAGLFRCIRKAGGSHAAGGIAATGILALYLLLTGLSVSAVRAVIMFAVLAGAEICGRKYDAFTALSAAAVLVVFWRPLSFWDGGFQLSFGAVCGILFICPLFQERVKRRNVLTNALCASASVQIAVLPILLYHFFEFPLYSFVLNLVVVPAMSLIVCLGISGGILILIFPDVGGILLFLCGRFLYCIELLCRLAERLPCRLIVTGRPEPEWILVYYLGVVAAVVIAGKSKKQKRHFAKIAAAVFLAACAVFVCQLPAARRGDVELVMLDVGQGDCFFLKNADGTACLIDGGSGDVSQVGKYRIEPFLKARGVDCLDFVFVTHGDADHTSGIAEMLERQNCGVKIRRLILPVREVWDEALRQLAYVAEQHEIPVFSMGSGAVLKSGNCTIACLQPGKEDAIESGNAASMVLELKIPPWKMLFTGDVEKDGERLLTERLQEKGSRSEYQILKVAHHGSRNSTERDFLKTVRPRVALISAGRKNSYGHPHPETIKRLEESGASVFLTAESGAVILTIDRKTMVNLKIFKYNENYEKFK